MLNFQITMTLMLFASALLLAIFPTTLIFMGEQTVEAIENSKIFLVATLCLPMPLILIGIFCTYQGVVNAIRALSDRPIHYALSIPFVK